MNPRMSVPLIERSHAEWLLHKALDHGCKTLSTLCSRNEGAMQQEGKREGDASQAETRQLRRRTRTAM